MSTIDEKILNKLGIKKQDLNDIQNRFKQVLTKTESQLHNEIQVFFKRFETVKSEAHKRLKRIEQVKNEAHKRLNTLLSEARDLKKAFQNSKPKLKKKAKRKVTVKRKVKRKN